MRHSNLILFKEKYNCDDYFLSVVESLFDKLVEFEYIPKSSVNKLIDCFLENVDELHIGSKNAYDYKSGYYDSVKKELYIKDVRNIPAVYLRLLYVITSHEVYDGKHSVGYSVTKLRRDSYKLEYFNYGFNRAVISNLVYKLCNMLPKNFNITSTPKTYNHDFLGFNIETQNDMYQLEGKILSELCYVLEVDQELLYRNLFSKDPLKYLEYIFNKKQFENKQEFLSLFDNISRKYNTYNKLAFLSNKLNDNYIEYKKHVLNDDITEIKKEKTSIEATINTTLEALLDNKADEEYSQDNTFEFNQNLSEALENLESELLSNLVKLQDILANNIIKIYSNLSVSKYACKLKRFNDMLIMPNQKVSNTITEIILYKLMPKTEITSINLIQKVKFALISKLLTDEALTDISNTFAFYNITNLENSETGTAIILLSSNKGIAKIVQIRGLNETFENSFNYDIEYIALDSLKYIMQANYSNIYVGDIEKLFTNLKDSFESLANISLDNLYVFQYNDKKYIVVISANVTYVIEYGSNYSFKLLNLSEQYKLFGKSTTLSKDLIRSTLPVLYNKAK